MLCGIVDFSVGGGGVEIWCGVVVEVSDAVGVGVDVGTIGAQRCLACSFCCNKTNASTGVRRADERRELKNTLFVRDKTKC